MESVEYTMDVFLKFYAYRPGVDCDEEETRVAYEITCLDKNYDVSPDKLLSVANGLVASKIKQGGNLSELSQRGLAKVINHALIIGKELYNLVQTSDGRDKAMEFLKNLVKLEQYSVLAQCLLKEATEDSKCVGWHLYRSEKKDEIMDLLNGLPKDVGEQIKSSCRTYNCYGDKYITEQIFGDGSSMPL